MSLKPHLPCLAFFANKYRIRRNWPFPQYRLHSLTHRGLSLQPVGVGERREDGNTPKRVAKHCGSLAGVGLCGGGSTLGIFWSYCRVLSPSGYGAPSVRGASVGSELLVSSAYRLNTECDKRHPRDTLSVGCFVSGR